VLKKLLPPVLFIIFACLMGLLNWLIPNTAFIPYPFNLLGVVIVLLGLTLASWHSRLFRKLQTNIQTFDEPDMLVEAGCFRYTRNPMYLGFISALFGMAIALHGALVYFVIATLFWLISDRWYVRFEEDEMHKKFGRDYEQYCLKVRRWL